MQQICISISGLWDFVFGFRFCYMKPFEGRCDHPEEEVGGGLITISTKRHGYNTKDPTESRSGFSEKATSKLKG